MRAKKTIERPWKRRRQYIIDRPMQMGVVSYLVSGLCGVALLCAGVLYVFLSGEAVPPLAPMQRFLLVANVTYFVLAGGILTLLTILLTHRFAGPAYVMRMAIKGMTEGDYTKRLTLRKKDYLKTLASDLSDLRDRWVRHDESSRHALELLDQAVEHGDTKEARELITRLREGLLVRAETTEDTPAPAPAEEREAVTTS